MSLTSQQPLRFNVTALDLQLEVAMSNFTFRKELPSNKFIGVIIKLFIAIIHLPNNQQAVKYYFSPPFSEFSKSVAGY